MTLQSSLQFQIQYQYSKFQYHRDIVVLSYSNSYTPMNEFDQLDCSEKKIRLVKIDYYYLINLI